MHRLLLTTALTLTACLLPSCRITDKGVDVSMVRDRVTPPEQDQVYIESGSNAGGPSVAPAAATYGYDITATNSYTVQPGDTLSKIAAIHQLSLADLYRANNLTGTSVIKVGQQLVIPQHHATQPAGTTTVTEPHAPAPRTGTTASSYTVQAGDTLSSIARRLGVSMQSLMQANHMTGDQASHLRIGQTLHIPTKR